MKSNLRIQPKDSIHAKLETEETSVVQSPGKPLCLSFGTQMSVDYDELSLKGCIGWDRSRVSFRLLVRVVTWKVVSLRSASLAPWDTGCKAQVPLSDAGFPSVPEFAPCFSFWIPYLLRTELHFRFCSTMANWTSSWQLPWQSAPWWPWTGRDQTNTKRHKERFGRSSNLITTWLVMCDKWINSTRYANSWGTQVVGLDW